MLEFNSFWYLFISKIKKNPKTNYFGFSLVMRLVHCKKIFPFFFFFFFTSSTEDDDDDKNEKKEYIFKNKKEAIEAFKTLLRERVSFKKIYTIAVSNIPLSHFVIFQVCLMGHFDSDGSAVIILTWLIK